MTRARYSNPLSKKHFNRIVRRPGWLQDMLMPLWGITWNLRGRTRCRLGNASMMAMSYHPAVEKSYMIELLCVTAQTDPTAGIVHYSDICMAHDFSLNPYPGARNRVLDPRDEGDKSVRRNDRPNGSWVRLAIDLDRLACLAIDQNWRLPAVPQLPQFLAGFPAKEPVTVTQAMRDRISVLLTRPVQEINRMTVEDLTPLAAREWDSLWQAPWTAGNDSNLWLIDAKYVNDFTNAVHLYEDFSKLVGLRCPNPVREIKQIQFTNPVRSCAQREGIDLDGVLSVISRGEDGERLQVIEQIDEPYDFTIEGASYENVAPMTPTRFTCSYDEAVDTLLRMRQGVQNALGVYANKFSPEEIEYATNNPDHPMVLHVEDAGKQLHVDDALRLMRQQLKTRPLIMEGTTDDDLKRALANPNADLTASQACRSQIMRRDVRMAPADAFMFSPQTLGRDRVYANLWAGAGWSPRATGIEAYNEPRQSKLPQKRQVEHATV